MVAQAVECMSSNHRVSGSNFDFCTNFFKESLLHIMFEMTDICWFGDGYVRLTRKMDMQHETVLT